MSCYAGEMNKLTPRTRIVAMNCVRVLRAVATRGQWRRPMNLIRKLAPFLVGLAAVLQILAPLAPEASAAGMGPGMTSGSSGRETMRGGGGYGFSSVGSALIVDAYPLEAQVFLDGRLLGTGRDLMAHVFPVGPGAHSIEIVAPGFQPYAQRFTASGSGFATRLRFTLVPETGR